MNNDFHKAVMIARQKQVRAKEGLGDYASKYLCGRNVPFRCGIEGIVPNIIFSTSTGVFTLTDGRLTQLFKGKFYGITRCRQWWFVARLDTDGKRDFLQNERVSDIYAFRIENHKVKDLRGVLFNIPGELHQIDISGGNLFIPHTGFRHILRIPVSEIFASKRVLGMEDASHIPVNAAPHCHLNSIFKKGEELMLIAHNYTMRTHQFSDLIYLNIETLKQRTINLNAHSAHNVFEDDNGLWYCDSNHHRLYRNGEIIFEREYLLRGLSMTENHIFLGGSDICYEQNKRYSNDGRVFVLDGEGNLMSELVFPELGDIYEIRQLSGLDKCMSDSIN